MSSNVTSQGEHALLDHQIDVILLGYFRDIRDIPPLDAFHDYKEAENRPPILTEEAKAARQLPVAEHARAVVLDIPEYSRQAMLDGTLVQTHVTIVYINASDLLKSNEPFDNVRMEYIPIPDQVVSCQPCLLRGTAVMPEWELETFIPEVFRRGYVNAEFSPRLAPIVPDTTGITLELRRADQHLAGRESRPARSDVIVEGKPHMIPFPTTSGKVNFDPSTHVNSLQPVGSRSGTPEPFETRSTLYVVDFPNFRRNDVLQLRPAPSHIAVQVPSAMWITSVRIPNEVEFLEQSTAKVYYLDLHCARDLVLGLLSLGYGSQSSLQFKYPFPHALPNGGLVMQYTHVPSFGTRSGYYSTFQSPNQVYRGIGQSPMSNFSSPASFMTASSPASFISARSAFNSSAYVYASGPSPAVRIETIREDEPAEPSMPAPLQQLRSNYYETLHQQDIIQPFDKELNWSGKGQHVTFTAHDAVPLRAISHLGSSMTATVDKVLCRRIALARKTMRCSRKWTVADALREVYHLQNLRHFHIIQLVGSYLQGRNFSILMYPVADCHLGQFLEDTSDMQDSEQDAREYVCRQNFLASTPICLASTMAFIHEHTTKHMDIKPQNILVRKLPLNNSFQPVHDWRIYLADFGLSRSFTSQNHSQTDGPTSRTPRYCAPEVYNDEPRGRSADIFSLGCVYLEILTVYTGHFLQDFADERRGDSDDESFHANLERVSTWIDNTFRAEHHSNPFLSSRRRVSLDLTNIVERMIDQEPTRRPLASELLSFFSGLFHSPALGVADAFASRSCCTQAPEPYVAYQSQAEVDVMSGQSVST